MSGVKVYNENYCAACYFRTIAEYPSRKCLIQLTERCNLHCEHCFVSADRTGAMIDFEMFREQIVPQLVINNIKKVYLCEGIEKIGENAFKVKENLEKWRFPIFRWEGSILLSVIPKLIYRLSIILVKILGSF